MFMMISRPRFFIIVLKACLAGYFIRYDEILSGRHSDFKFGFHVKEILYVTLFSAKPSDISALYVAR
jgi:hypothetical protein